MDFDTFRIRLRTVHLTKLNPSLDISHRNWPTGHWPMTLALGPGSPKWWWWGCQFGSSGRYIGCYRVSWKLDHCLQWSPLRRLGSLLSSKEKGSCYTLVRPNFVGASTYPWDSTCQHVEPAVFDEWRFIIHWSGQNKTQAYMAEKAPRLDIKSKLSYFIRVEIPPEMSSWGPNSGPRLYNVHSL